MKKGAQATILNLRPDLFYPWANRWTPSNKLIVSRRKVGKDAKHV